MPTVEVSVTPNPTDLTAALSLSDGAEYSVYNAGPGGSGGSQGVVHIYSHSTAPSAPLPNGHEYKPRSSFFVYPQSGENIYAWSNGVDITLVFDLIPGSG